MPSWLGPELTHCGLTRLAGGNNQSSLWDATRPHRAALYRLLTGAIRFAMDQVNAVYALPGKILSFVCVHIQCT